MNSKNLSNFSKLLFSVTAVLFIVSCNVFSPDYEHFENIGTSGNNNTIRGLMDNFVYSYTFKDSFLYDDILDDEFIFEYDNEGISESWTKDEDLRITKSMFRSFKRIDLMFNTVFPENSDEINTSISSSFRIGFYSGEEIINLTGYAEFIFKKYTFKNDSVSYKIKYWKDLK